VSQTSFEFKARFRQCGAGSAGAAQTEWAKRDAEGWDDARRARDHQQMISSALSRGAGRVAPIRVALVGFAERVVR
jgi:hypothetical protein